MTITDGSALERQVDFAGVAEEVGQYSIEPLGDSQRFPHGEIVGAVAVTLQTDHMHGGVRIPRIGYALSRVFSEEAGISIGEALQSLPGPQGEQGKLGEYHAGQAPLAIKDDSRFIEHITETAFRKITRPEITAPCGLIVVGENGQQSTHLFYASSLVQAVEGVVYDIDDERNDYPRDKARQPLIGYVHDGVRATRATRHNTSKERRTAFVNKILPRVGMAFIPDLQRVSSRPALHAA